MVTELRDFDTNTIVLYTDDRQVANKVEAWRECFKVITYEQEQYSKKRVALIGLDFYLPKTKIIQRRIKRLVDGSNLVFTGTTLYAKWKSRGSKPQSNSKL